MGEGERQAWCRAGGECLGLLGLGCAGEGLGGSGAGVMVGGSSGFSGGLVLLELGCAATAYLGLGCGVASYGWGWEGLGTGLGLGKLSAAGARGGSPGS